MSTPPILAAAPANSDGRRPRQRARKRRKYNHAKESIYLAPDLQPYPRAIKPAPAPGPSSGYAPINEAGESIEPPEITPRITEDKGKGKGKGVNSKDRGEDEDRYCGFRARAMKAWDTKRKRQQERFEQLEASSSLLELNTGSGLPIDFREGLSRSERGYSIPAIDPLLDIDLSEDRDVPKDDILFSLQNYASRYYTANNLLLGHRNQDRHSKTMTGVERSLSRTATPTRMGSLAMEDSGSEYSAAQAAADMANDKEELQGEVYSESIDIRESFAGAVEPRKRGGQRGKRKLKDMYLALDGSALLTLGVLIQEQIIHRLQEEGYVPASSLEVENEEDPETNGMVNAFEVSDDSELESEEGQDNELYD